MIVDSFTMELLSEKFQKHTIHVGVILFENL